MPKITVHGGPSNKDDESWPGNSSQQSQKKQEISETNTAEQDQQPVQMTENLSEKDQTETYSVPSTDGLNDKDLDFLLDEGETK